jgi:hypothetical protein
MAAIELTLRAANAIGEVSPKHGMRANGVSGGARLNMPARAAANLKLLELTSTSVPIFHIAVFCPPSTLGSVRARIGCGRPPRQEPGAGLSRPPVFAKSHSQGEYVFDHGWAEAYERAGGSYYPKLQVTVPFTPASGRRLLVRPGPRAEAVTEALAGGLAEICRRSHASSVHVTFLTEPEWHVLGAQNYLLRTQRQFHWENAGYATFDDFLAALASRKRKTIRREREDALANGITVHWLTGSDLTEACGTPSSSSTWRPARANGAALSHAHFIRSSVRRWPPASSW